MVIKKFVAVKEDPIAYGNIASNTRVRHFIRSDGTCKCVNCGIVSVYAATYRHHKELCGRHHDLVCYDGERVSIMTVDHILPKSLGGANANSNYRPMCSKCNSKRGNRLSYQEFVRILENLDKHLRDSDEGKQAFRTYVEQHYPERMETLNYILY